MAHTEVSTSSYCLQVGQCRHTPHCFLDRSLSDGRLTCFALPPIGEAYWRAADAPLRMSPTPSEPKPQLSREAKGSLPFPGLRRDSWLIELRLARSLRSSLPQEL